MMTRRQDSDAFVVVSQAACTMTTQPMSSANVGDLAFGKRTVAPMGDVFGVEVIGNAGIVTEFEQLVDTCDQFGRDSLASCVG
jgi:hypothetical protein